MDLVEGISSLVQLLAIGFLGVDTSFFPLEEFDGFSPHSLRLVPVFFKSISGELDRLGGHVNWLFLIFFSELETDSPKRLLSFPTPKLSLLPNLLPPVGVDE